MDHCLGTLRQRTAAVSTYTDRLESRRALDRVRGNDVNDSPNDTIAELTVADRRRGLVFDFDGVLAPIVRDPNKSQLGDGIASLLRQLTERLELVGIISGRPLDFLIERVPIPGLWMLGSYGIEEIHGGDRVEHPGLKRWVSVVSAARRHLEREFRDDDGILVEDKRVAVAVHWRQSCDHDAAAERVREVIAEAARRSDLQREPGKLVEELRAPLNVDKGTAIRRLASEAKLDFIAYAGDDSGDIPAFRATLALGGRAILIDHALETDPALRALASESFEGTDSFKRWLAALVELLPRTTEGGPESAG
jgi:trehalose 6-phosphate phosphatase